MLLKLGNQSLEVDKNFEQYNTIRKLFSNKAAQYADSFAKKYRACKDLDDGFPIFVEMLWDAEQSGIEKACAFLFKAGVVDVSSDSFAEEYYDQYICVDDMLEVLYEKLQEIADLSDNFELQQQLRRMNRGRWYGGGFGIKGAVTGAVNAAALNAATGAVHSVGDFFRSIGNGIKVQRLKSALFEDPEVFSAMFNAIYHGHLSSFYGLRDELVDNGILKPLYFDSAAAIRIEENAEKYAKDKGQKEELILKSIFTHPYQVELYDPLLKYFPHIDGFDEFVTFFGVKSSIEVYDSFNLRLKLKQASRMPEKDYQQLTEKVSAYVSLSIRYRYNVFKEINELSGKYVKVCQSVPVVQNAINLVNYQFQHSIDLVKPIITALENHKIALTEAENERKKKEEKEQQLKELSRIRDRSRMSQEDYFKCLQDINDYSVKYDHNVSDFVQDLLLRLDGWSCSVKSCTEVIEGLSKLKCHYYPQIERIIPAFRIRKIILENKQHIDLSTHYVFSPIILDFVDKARAGNAAIQQWLVELLYQYYLIEHVRSLWLHGNPEDKKTASMTMDLISDIIMFLFDQPELYSFDLFMRVKFSYPFADSIDEYLESIAPFKNNESCIAGIYEYGRILSENKSFSAGLPYIKKAAEHGYSRAAVHLHKHYHKVDPNSFDTLFYRLIRPNRYETCPAYLYNPHVEDEWGVVTLRFLHDVIVGNIFSLETKEKISDYLSDVLYAYKRENDGSGIGYLGDFGDKFLLKTAKTCLSVPSKENALLSYSYKYVAGNTNETYMVVLTDEHLYWGKDIKNVQNASYETEFATLKSEFFRSDIGNIQKVWQLYTVLHNYYRHYAKNKPISVLMKMAFAGNPLAICRLLSDPSISEDKKDIWRRHQQNWEQRGKYYAVCPQCHNERSQCDMFCPDCGAKI